MKKFLGVFFVLFLATTSFATTMQLLTLDQLTQASQIIVVGNITSVSSSWQNNLSDMATFTQVKVTQYVKSGTNRPTQITLKHPGGKDLGPFNKYWFMVVPGVPKFTTNAKAMFFCTQKGKYWELTGWSQGYFRVHTTSTGQEIVDRDFEGADFVNDENRTNDQMSLNHLIDLVRRVK